MGTGDHETLAELVAFYSEVGPTIERAKSRQIQETNLPDIEKVSNLDKACLDAWKAFKGLVRQILQGLESGSVDWDGLWAECQRVEGVIAASSSASAGEQKADQRNFIDWLKNKIGPFKTSLQKVHNKTWEPTQAAQYLGEDGSDFITITMGGKPF